MTVTRDDSYNSITIETLRDCSSNQPPTSRSDPDIIEPQAFEPASPHGRDTDGPPVFQIIEPVSAPPISAGHRLLIALLVVTGNLIQFVSNFITLNAGLSLSNALSRDMDHGKSNWMAASYPLTQGAFVLIAGRLGAVYGHQYLALIGLGIFTVFSFINGFCRSFESFIAVRALSGIGGGIFMPNAVAILALMVPSRSARNILIGMYAASPPLGGVIGGLATGGCAASKSIWSWTGLFSAIAGASAICLILLYWLLPKEEPVDKGGGIDLFGAVLGVSSLLLYSIAWNLAPSLGWSNVYPIVTLVLSISMFCAFLVWEHRFATEPVMPLRIFRTPTFLALVLVVLSTYMSWGIVLWYSIAWQQTLRDVSVLQTGIHFVPSGISALIAVVLAAYLLPRVAAQWIMAFGIAVVFAASLLLATMPVEQTYWAQVFPAMLICGFCPDFVYVAAQSIASNSVGRKYQGIAGSLIGTLNLYGNSLGMGFAGTIEAEVIKRAGKSVLSETMDQMVSGYRAALYFSAGIAGMALLIDFIFVRVPRTHGGN